MDSENEWDDASNIIMGIDVLDDLEVEKTQNPEQLHDSYIDIYKKLPTDTRPSRESEKLRFRFSREFFADKSYKDQSIVRKAQDQAREIIEKFDFDKADHGIHEAEPKHNYIVDTFGNISLTDITRE